MDLEFLWSRDTSQGLESFKWHLWSTGDELQEVGSLCVVHVFKNFPEPSYNLVVWFVTMIFCIFLQINN